VARGVQAESGTGRGGASCAARSALLTSQHHLHRHTSPPSAGASLPQESSNSQCPPLGDSFLSGAEIASSQPARSDPHSCQLRALRLVLHAADSAWERANLGTDMGGCVSKQSKSSAGEAPPPASPPVAGDTSAQLLAAATSGDVAAVRAALDGGANCNCADEVRGARWPRPVLRTLCRVSVRRAAPPASRARRRLRQRAARAAGRAAPAAYG